MYLAFGEHSQVAQPATATEGSHVQRWLTSGSQGQLLQLQGGGHVPNVHLEQFETLFL